MLSTTKFSLCNAFFSIYTLQYTVSPRARPKGATTPCLFFCNVIFFYHHAHRPHLRLSACLNSTFCLYMFMVCILQSATQLLSVAASVNLVSRGTTINWPLFQLVYPWRAFFAGGSPFPSFTTCALRLVAFFKFQHGQYRAKRASGRPAGFHAIMHNNRVTSSLK